MIVYVYSKNKNGTLKITRNFKVREFACKDGSDTVFINLNLVAVLQDIRDHFGKAVQVTSGYRTDAYNKKVGGATYSQHKYGGAADIYINGVTPKQIYDYVNNKYPDKLGLGLYNTFVHVDVRDGRSRWKG